MGDDNASGERSTGTQSVDDSFDDTDDFGDLTIVPGSEICSTDPLEDADNIENPAIVSDLKKCHSGRAFVAASFVSAAFSAANISVLYAMPQATTAIIKAFVIPAIAHAAVFIAIPIILLPLLAYGLECVTAYKYYGDIAHAQRAGKFATTSRHLHYLQLTLLITLLVIGLAFPPAFAVVATASLITGLLQVVFATIRLYHARQQASKEQVDFDPDEVPTVPTLT